MGRKIKYETDHEKRQAQRRWRREYYQRNKEKCRKARMDYYWRKKEMEKKCDELGRMTNFASIVEASNKKYKKCHGK